MSTLRLLKTNLKPSENFIVEDIYSFLNNNSYVTNCYYIYNFQYVKIANNLTLKFDAPQADLTKVNRPDYASIYQDNVTYYYFVKNIKQVAQSTLAVELEMDVLNTFEGKYSIKDTSLIEREHRNRIKVLRGSAQQPPEFSDGVTSQKVQNIFSKTDEKLSPKLWKATQETIYENSDAIPAYAYNWYLIYRTDGTNGLPAVDVCSDHDLTISRGGSGYFDLTATAMTAGMTYIIAGSGISVTLPIEGGSGSVATATITDGYIAFYRTTIDNYSCISYSYVGNQGFYNSNGVEHYTVSGQTLAHYNQTIRINAGTKLYHSTTPSTDSSVYTLFPYTALNIGSVVVSSISSLDRTLNAIVKVIQCPYCPLVLVYDATNDIYTFEPAWSYNKSTSMMRSYTIDLNFVSDIQVLDYTDKMIQTLAYSRDLTQYLKNTIEEPKLQVSPLTEDKFIYDSYTYTWKPENVDNRAMVPGSQCYLSIQYKQSNTVSSDLGFKFTYTPNDIDDTEDFGKYLLSNRNNELPLFSSEYLNYMKNGYNYDKKKANTALTTDALKSLVTLGAGAISAAVGGPLGAIGGVALAAQAAGSAISLASNYSEAMNAIKQTQDKALNTGYTVSDINNLDLFNWYGENKITHVLYKPDGDIEAAIKNLFRLYGYSENQYELPDTRSRYWYNYVKGQIEIDGEDYQPSSDNKEQIINKFKEGVTYLHNRAATINKWDINREYENIEISVLPQAWRVSYDTVPAAVTNAIAVAHATDTTYTDFSWTDARTTGFYYRYYITTLDHHNYSGVTKSNSVAVHGILSNINFAESYVEQASPYAPNDIIGPKAHFTAQ